MQNLEALVAQGDDDDFDGENSFAEWAFVYHYTDADLVNKIISKHREACKVIGMQFKNDPQFIEIPDDKELKKDGLKSKFAADKFIHCINSSLDSRKPEEVKIVFVLTQKEEDYP